MIKIKIIESNNGKMDNIELDLKKITATLWECENAEVQILDEKEELEKLYQEFKDAPQYVNYGVQLTVHSNKGDIPIQLIKFRR